jgi:hypothetical protein
MLLRIFVAAVIVAGPAGAAQDLRFRYPAPPAGTVDVQKDVLYGTADGTRLLMDVYRPAAAGTARHPLLIFFNTAVGPQKTTAFGGFYGSWAQTAASKGIVGIVPDLRQGNQAQDFQKLVTHLAERAADYGAAVINEFRRDLPVLYIRAGLDRPPLNVTLLNHPTGHHAFEALDDDDATRDIIDRTLDFVKRATAAPYQAAMRKALPEATAASHVVTGNYGQAAKLYAELVAAHPDDARLRLAYGEALLGDKQFATACSEFERLKGKGLGPRDLGLPAARACMQTGDAEAAIAWLRAIPQRFLPGDVAKDPVFASIKSRADFRALFEPR